MSYAEAYYVSSILKGELRKMEKRLSDMKVGEAFEKLMKDVVAEYETKHRNPDIKDVYNMMGMIGAEADRNAEFKMDLQNFLKVISGK